MRLPCAVGNTRALYSSRGAAPDEPRVGQNGSYGSDGGGESNVNLDCMKVAELAEELEARGETRTGRKAQLQQRLRAVIIVAQRDVPRGRGEEFGEGVEEGEEED